MLNVTSDKGAIRIGPRFTVSFLRTLRIPDDRRTYPLPPGFGTFPLLKVEDYLDRVPSLWREQGGVFIPLYQREALWLGFRAASWKPNAVKIAVGGVNAISGELNGEGLHVGPQNYIVCPDQPWLDGIHAGHGSVRQFVAMPLGLGYTVEASVTGEETFGGIQVTVFEPKPGKFPDQPPANPDSGPTRFAKPRNGSVQMGLGAGGVMKQKIYSDPYNIDTWDQDNYGCIFIHIVNSLWFQEITGTEPPPAPIDAKTYTEWGLPWFDLYDEARKNLAPTERLTRVKTVSARDAERGEPTENDDSFEIPESQVKKLRPKDSAGKNRQPSLPDAAEQTRKRK